MIIGIGVDICNVERLAQLRRKYGARFLDRVFTPVEQERCGNGPACDERYAARFAAKEAFMKAIGTGWGHGLTFLDIEVATEDTGRPVLTVTGEARQIADRAGVSRIHISLSHERDSAVAFVVLEG
jgi:holo-[acyl-carrier protein] synthase